MAASRFERARAGWRFQLQWVFANAVAGAVTLTVTGAMIRTGNLNADMVVVVFEVVLGTSL